MQKVKFNGKLLKNILLTLVFLALVGAVIGLAIQRDRTVTERLGGEAYTIGLIDEVGEDKDGNTAIRTRDGVTVRGLKCTLAKDAKIKFQLFFYDEAGKFISASAELTTDYDGSAVPGTAETVRIMITPTEDEDGKITIVEVLGYAKQLAVSYEK